MSSRSKHSSPTCEPSASIGATAGASVESHITPDSPSRIALGMPKVTAPDFDPHPFSAEKGLVDSFGRGTKDLRVSVTDRCNLRCTYCMPAEGLHWIPRQDLLTDEEIIRLLSLALEVLGIETIRFTGGEPLLRASLPDLVSAAAQLRTHAGRKPALAMTTNGLGLEKHAATLRAAGLDRVNISLDAATPVAFQEITRRDRFNDVMRGIRGAQEAGLEPVKINAVIVPGFNESQILPLLDLCLDNGWQLRFIEQMPLGPPEKWSRSALCTAEDILHVLSSAAVLTPHGKRGAAPAELFDVTRKKSPSPEIEGQVGIIASVTRPFCAACDRTRLTADGMIRNCLFGNDELSLRDLLRSGASDTELADAWSALTFAKKRGHGSDTPLGIPLQPQRPMSAIGG